MFMSAHHKDEAHTPDDPGWRSFGALLDAVKRAVAAGRFKSIDPLTAAQVLWMNVHGVACALITMPPEQWPHGPAANDLVDRVIENGIRGLARRSGAGLEPWSRSPARTCSTTGSAS